MSGCFFLKHGVQSKNIMFTRVQIKGLLTIGSQMKGFWFHHVKQADQTVRVCGV